MPNLFIQFAAEVAEHGHEAQHAAEQAGGLGALGLNLQSFLFQLITFVIVMLLLRTFVFKKLIATLEERRLTVENSLQQASDTEAEVKKTEARIAEMLKEARAQADDAIATGHKEAAALAEATEAKARQKAEHIVSEARAQMDVELTKAREALKAETAQLVAQATEHIIKEKLDSAKDERLISDAIKKAGGA